MRRILQTLLMLVAIAVSASAQYWESGTMKTNSFYNYTSGGNTYSKTEVSYLINPEVDGCVEVGTAALGAVLITNITLYAVTDGNEAYVASDNQALTVNDVAAGIYRVKISGRPTDSEGRGGNFTASYVFTPATWINDPEPNNDWTQSSLIDNGATQHGHLGYRHDNSRDTKDWFRIVVPDEGTVTFSTTTTTSLRLGSLNMYTLKAADDGEEADVAFRNSKDMDGYGADTTIVYTVPDVKPGTYYIRLDRYAGFGSYKLKYTFAASSYKPDSDDNDTWDKAVAMQLDTPTEGRLGYYFNGDTDTRDWMIIRVPEEGKVTFTTKTETTLRLGSLNIFTLNDDGTDTKYRSSKDMDGYGEDVTVVYEVPDMQAGTYYIRLDRYTGYGGYELTAYFTSHAATADAEPNNEWTEAITLNSGPSVSGQLGYSYNNNTDTRDWYKIVVPKEGKAVFSTTTETTLRLGSLNMYTYNADSTDTKFRNSQDMDGYGADTTIVYTVPDLKAGTYFLRLDRYSGYGTYSLQYVFTPNSRQNDDEPNDEWTQAKEVMDGSVQQGGLGYNYQNDTDTKDWFKITVPDEGTMVFAATTETTLRLGSLNVFVLNEDGSNVALRNSKDMDAYGADTTIVYTMPDVKAGTYYIRLDRYAGYGGYDLAYTFTQNPYAQDGADNDTWDKATVVDNNTTQEGRLGYKYANSDMDVRDWLRIDVPDEGSATFKATTDVTLRLGSLNMYTLKAAGDGEEADVAFRNSKDMDAYGADTTIVYTVPDLKPGTYYIRLDRYSGYGGYKLQYAFTPNVHSGDAATNDSVQGATRIELGTAQQGRLGHRYANDTDVYDWFYFDVPYVGSVSFSLTTETTLRLGSLNLYVPEADGDMRYVMSKDMDGYGKDTTVVFNMGGLGAGRYYIRQDRYSGCGGYTMKLDYVRNPYDRDNIDNPTFETRYQLTEGVTVSTTLGYEYIDRNDRDWYDLGMMHGRQIDVTICPDTTLTLVIGVVEMYRVKGYEDDGDPILERVASERLERSQATISYVDKGTEDSHYVFYIPRYSGYGGYTVLLGKDSQDGEVAAASNLNISVMTEGRNTVRKGVPCDNPITITNTSSAKSAPFIVAIAATDNVDIIGFHMHGRYSSEYLPIDSVTVMDDGEMQHTALFLVPSLDPWESYTFTMTSEGKGDIQYSRTYQEVTTAGGQKIIVSGTTFAVVTVLGYVVDAVVGDKINDFITDNVSAAFELDEEERQQYARCLGTTVDQLYQKKQETGIAAYSVNSVVKKAAGDVIGLLPYGKIAVKTVGILETMQQIIPSIRRRIWYWIYKDLGYITDDMTIADGKVAISDVVGSWDPNEMVGPQGVGDEHYIGDVKTINYRILFENKAEAGDAAYRVRISDELDPEVFDLSTVRFGETSHDGTGYNWEMTRDGNVLSWDIKGIELPPNVNAPEGEGYVTFSVDLKSGVKDGDVLKNKATIIFDKNFPIETNVFSNTIDLTAPVTTMAEANYNAEGTEVKVVCQSQDAASGVQSYLFFVSKDGGDYSYYGQSVTGELIYPVAAAGDYRFFALAIDNVGNTERIAPQSIQATQGISTVFTDGNTDGQLRIYTTDGRYVGNSLSGLKKGVYVIGGSKFVVK